MRTQAAPPPSRILNGATSQLERLRTAPAPETVEVDGRSLAQLLAFGARYGALIEFYDLDNAPQGNWSEFFAADPAVAAALHACLDLTEIEAGLRRRTQEIRGSIEKTGRMPLLLRQIGVIVRLLGILDRVPPQGTDVRRQLAHFARGDRRDGLARPLKRLHRYLAEQEPDRWFSQEQGGHLPLLILLDEIVERLIDALRHGAQAAQAAMEASLAAPNHAPQAALYNAFVGLFIKARRELNTFPRRFLNFYFADILKQASRAAAPDHVFLTFTLAKGADQAAIPAGTLFSAGVDGNGEDIAYAADSSLEVMPVTVTALSVHRITRGADDDTAAGVLCGTVRQGADGLIPSSPFPLFGGDRPGPAGSLTMVTANIGFALSTPTLLLWGGDRSVTVKLTPVTPAASGQAESPAFSIADLARLMEHAFELYYSTAGGWMAVDGAGFAPATNDPTAIAITFDLPAEAPPLVPLSTSPAADAPAPTLPAGAFPDPGDLPTLLAKLQYAPAGPDGTSDPAHALDILSRIEASLVSVEATVANLAPQSLAGPSGSLDATQNFAPFGLPPTQNAVLKIDVPELFVKTLLSLAVTIDWAGLPVTSTGFQGYYKDYVIDADGDYSAQPLFDNTSFKATLGVVSPGYWTLDPTAQLYLFQTDAGSATPQAAAPVLPASVLTAAGITPVEPPPAYYNAAANALLVTLTAPGTAFGNVLYSSNLTYASTTHTAALQTSLRHTGTTAAQTAVAQIAQASTVNATAADPSYLKTLGDAVNKAVSALNGSALTALHQAAATPRSGWLQDLQTALTNGTKGSLLGGLWSKLTGNGKTRDASAVTAQLKDWLTAHEADLADAGAALAQHAKAALTAAESLISTLTLAAGQPVAVARPVMAAALQAAHSALAAAGGPPSGAALSGNSVVTLPNAPWLPMASSITVSYDTAAAVQVMHYAEGQDSEEQAADSPDGTEAGTLQYRHLGLFDQIHAGVTSLLPQLADAGALYIDLSAPVEQVALLFVLQAGSAGWSSDTPAVAWDQRVDGVWVPATILGDSTNGLSNSGIVTFKLKAQQDAQTTPRLRARSVTGTDDCPEVKSVTANAVTATWAGPGGAAQLGKPLPAGTITASQSALAGIGAINQPEESWGGHALAVGPAFDLWMAERLRHKGFAIDAWDYARLVLAAIPSLWQVAVIPATHDQTGRPAPGKVWVVAVAGTDTPNITDPTIPQVNPSVLAEIGEVLKAVASPFADITVTNPPYRRITVIADLIFADTDTAAAWTEKLQGELIKWLSPWPDPQLGLRPADYYTRQSVADFINQRAYVVEVLAVALRYEDGGAGEDWCYLTSAAQHVLTAVSKQTLNTRPSQHRRSPAEGRRP